MKNRTSLELVPRKVGSTGLTLLELVVVVGILGLLAGVAIPSMSKAVDNKTADDTAGRMKAVGAAIEAYAADMIALPQSLGALWSANGTLPPASTPGNGNGGGGGGGGGTGNGQGNGGGGCGEGGGGGGGNGGGGGGGPTIPPGQPCGRWCGPYATNHIQGIAGTVTEFHRDNWGRDLVWTPSTGGTGTLRSAGPDQTQGTADDITLTVDIRPTLRKITVDRLNVLNTAIRAYNARGLPPPLNGSFTSVLGHLRQRGFLSSQAYVQTDGFGAAWIMVGNNPCTGVRSPNVTN